MSDFAGVCVAVSTRKHECVKHATHHGLHVDDEGDVCGKHAQSIDSVHIRAACRGNRVDNIVVQRVAKTKAPPFRETQEDAHASFSEVTEFAKSNHHEFAL